jgi:anti-anti-sigma factor
VVSNPTSLTRGREHDRIAAEEGRGVADEHRGRDAARIDERGVRPPAAYTIRETSPGVLALEGELDIASAPELRKWVDEAPGESLVLDFGRVTFIDSAVLKELLRARVELAERGVRLMLAAVRPPVKRLMDLTRTSELFEEAADVDEALRRLS